MRQQPHLQALLDQHGTPGSSATLSPTFKRLTPAPTCTTVLRTGAQRSVPGAGCRPGGEPVPWPRPGTSVSCSCAGPSMASHHTQTCGTCTHPAASDGARAGTTGGAPGRLVADDHGAVHDEVCNAALLPVVHVRPADADRLHLHAHHALPQADGSARAGRRLPREGGAAKHRPLCLPGSHSTGGHSSPLRGARRWGSPRSADR